MEQAVVEISGSSRSQTNLCLLCSLPLEVRFSAVPDPESGEIFSIWQCRQCGLGHTRPTPEDLKRYYKPGYHGDRHSFSAEHCVRRRLRWLHQVSGRAQGKKLLDIGCGEGAFLLAARRTGWQVWGTELEPAAARAQDLPVAASLGELADAAPYDCVTFWHSLEHMPDPVKVIDDAVSLLKPGGSVMIAVPDAAGWQAAAFGESWLHLDVPRHLYHFSQVSLERLLKSSGLKTIRIWHQEFEYDLLGWSQSALNKIFSARNVFFDVLRGQIRRRTLGQRALHSLIGSVSAGLALPLLPMAASFGHGGTLVVAATKS